MANDLAGLKRRLWAVVGVFVLAGLAGCGPGNTVSVQIQGYHMALDQGAAKTGTVTFHINNQNGQVEHEFVIIQTPLPAAQLPMAANSQVDESGLKIVARSDKVDVGQSATLTADLPPGHYVLICNIVGHYQLGMHADFIVTP